MHAYSEYSVHLQQVQCILTVDTMYTSSEYNVCLQWIQYILTVNIVGACW